MAWTQISSKSAGSAATTLMLLMIYEKGDKVSKQEALEYNGIKDQYKANDIEYHQTMFPRDGVIVAQHMFTLEDKKAEYIDRGIPLPMMKPITPLITWSDVVFLLWQQFCDKAKAPVHSLEWMFDVTLKDETAIAVAEKVLDGGDGMLKPWPGTTLSRGSASGRDTGMQALLGIPGTAARGVVEMLAQHQDAFPETAIDKVVLYNGAPEGSQSREYCIAVHITSKSYVRVDDRSR